MPWVMFVVFRLFRSQMSTKGAACRELYVWYFGFSVRSRAMRERPCLSARRRGNSLGFSQLRRESPVLCTVTLQTTSPSFDNNQLPVGAKSIITTFKFFLNICTTLSPDWKCLRSKYHIYVFLNKIFKFLEWFKDIKSDLIKQVAKISIYHSKIYFYLIHFNNELKEEILLSEIYKIKFLSCKGVQSHLVLNFCLCAVR